jgi:predicted RNase H-like HicB family nuclease
MAKSYRATFIKRKKWWVGWSEDMPGAQTQGKSLDEAKENLRDAIRLMQKPVDLNELPKTKVVRARIRL